MDVVELGLFGILFTAQLSTAYIAYSTKAKLEQHCKEETKFWVRMENKV